MPHVVDHADESGRNRLRLLSVIFMVTGGLLIARALPWRQIGWALRGPLGGSEGLRTAWLGLLAIGAILLGTLSFWRRRRGRPLRLPTALLVGLGLLLSGAGLLLTWQPDLVVRLLGPPRVEAREFYAAGPGGPRFDHTRLDGLLKRHVSPNGLVDYERLSAEAGELDAYLGDLARADFDGLGRDEKLAFLINAYNACTLRLILDHYPLASIKDIPSDARWDGRTWSLGGRRLTLSQIEHDELRARFIEPRIHFAINCASLGCPPLRAEAFRGDSLEAQLEDHARQTHQSPRFTRWNPSTRVLELSEIYRWFATDFEQVAPSVVAFVARYRPGVAAARGAGAIEPRWIPYDWSLNEVKRR